MTLIVTSSSGEPLCFRRSLFYRPILEKRIGDLATENGARPPDKIIFSIYHIFACLAVSHLVSPFLFSKYICQNKRKFVIIYVIMKDIYEKILRVRNISWGLLEWLGLISYLSN